MKKSFYSLVLSLLIASLAVPNAFATCTQGAQCHVGGCFVYQYLYNIDFSQGCAWTYSSGASAVTNNASGMCGVFPNYAQLAYNGGAATQIWQDVTMPSTESSTSWTLGFNLDVHDPNLSSSNALYVQVYDATTFATLATSATFRGSDGDLSCRAFTTSFTTNYSLANHTIEVLIHASIPSNTGAYFHITSVQLDG